MTFLEAAIELLRQAGRPLHFKELTERAIAQKLLDHLGRTPELTMQARLAQETKKGHMTLLVREKPGVFGLRQYEKPRTLPPAAAPTPAEGEAPGGKRRRRRV